MKTITSISKILLLSISLSILVMVLRQDNVNGQQQTVYSSQLRQLLEQKSKHYCDKASHLKKKTQKMKEYSQYENEYRTMDMKDNVVAEMIKGKTNQSELAVAMTIYCVFYILMLVTIIIGYWCYFWCCVCDSCCPPFKCCRRDYELNPVTKKESVIYMAIMIVISIATIVSASIGFAKTGDIRYATSQAVCEFLKMPENLMNGVKMDDNSSFIGVEKLMDQMKQINTDMKNYSKTIQDSIGDSSQYDKKYKAILDQTILVSNFKDVKTTSVESSSLTYLSEFNKNAGPYTQIPTLSYQIKTFNDATLEPLNSALDLMISASKTFSAAISSLSEQLNKGIKEGQNLSDKFNRLYENMVKTSDNYIEMGQDIYIIVMKIMMGFILGCGCLNLMIAITLLFSRIKCLRYFFHTVWILSCAFLIIMFVFIILMKVVYVTTYQTCGLYYNILQSESSLREYQLLPNDVVDTIKVCLWDGNGDLAKGLDVGSVFDQVKSFTHQVDSFIKQADKDDAKVINTFYEKQKSLVDQYKVGKMEKMKIETDNFSSPKNPAYAIEQLNRYTDYGVQNTHQTTIDCRKTQDQFVYDVKDCTYSNIYKDADSLNFGTQTCVVISQSTSTSLKARYQSAFSKCATISSYLALNLDRFFAYDKSRFDNYDKMGTKVIDVRTSVFSYTNSVGNVLTSISKSAGPVDRFSKDIQYLLANINCRIINVELQQIYKVMCLNMVPQIDTIITFCSVSSILLFFSTFFVYLSAMNFSHLEKLGQTKYQQQQDQPADEISSQQRTNIELLPHQAAFQ